MSTPPVLVATYPVSAWNTSGLSKTAAPTAATGDVLVVAGITADEGTTLTTPTGGSLTYLLKQNVTVTDFTQLYLWTVDPIGSGPGAFTMTVTTAGSDEWGFVAFRFSGSDGIGLSAKTNSASGTPLLPLTTTQAKNNSAIVLATGDWNALDGANRVPRVDAGNYVETVYQFVATFYTAYVGYHPDVGPGGNTPGLGFSAVAGQKWSCAAVEVLGKADVSSPATPDPKSQVDWHPSLMRRR